MSGCAPSRTLPVWAMPAQEGEAFPCLCIQGTQTPTAVTCPSEAEEQVTEA